jgi:hypothetical protein
VSLRQPLVREALLSAAAAASIAAALAWLGPPGTDLAAHAYQRTVFLEHGFTLWNNYWYAGRYSFVTYSVFYYPLAALLGIRLLAVATVALAALAFAVVVWREWGATTRWSSRTFAIVWAGIVLSAAFPFALGVAIALLALWSLQAGTRWRFAALAALTIAASPLAFLLLVVLLAGVALARRSALRRNWVAVAGVGAAGLAELALWRIFPGGRYPFAASELAADLVFCVLCLALTWRVESARVLRFFFGVYLIAVVGAYLIPSAIGENVARLRYAAIPLAVLVFSLRQWQPRLVGVTAIALAIAWNVSPLAYSAARNAGDVTTHETTWVGAIAFLHAHLDPSYRVEAVDTVTHSAAAYLAEAGIPLARGWYRQDDFPQNEVLYDDDLGPKAYLAWLRGLGVRYVVLPHATVDYSSQAEAALVRSGRVRLRPVFRTRELTIFAVPRARSIVTGPAAPQLTSLTESAIGVVVHRGGTYRIAVRWSPYWHASLGCLGRGRDGMLQLTTRHARFVRLRFHVDAVRALGELVSRGDRAASRCSA